MSSGEESAVSGEYPEIGRFRLENSGKVSETHYKTTVMS